MQKWNMIIDVAECTNCNLCTLAAMDEYVGNEFPGYSAPMPKHGHRWIDILQKERGQVPMIDVAYVPTMCNHCDNAPCEAKGGDAVKKRADGIVLIDPEKAKGRKDIVEAARTATSGGTRSCSCRRPGPSTPTCIDQGWQQTRGQQSCPTGAMRAIKVEDDEMARMAREEDLEVMKPELGTRPRVYYRNLWRYSKCFIGGTLAAEANGVVDCVEGANIMLSKDGTHHGRNHRATITGTSSSTSSTRTPAPMSSRYRPEGPKQEDGRGQARGEHQSRRDQAVFLRISSRPSLAGR